MKSFRELIKHLYKEHHDTFAIAKELEETIPLTAEANSERIIEMWENEMKDHFIEEEKYIFPRLIKRNITVTPEVQRLIEKHDEFRNSIIPDVKRKKNRLSVLRFAREVKQHIIDEEKLFKSLAPDPYSPITKNNMEDGGEMTGAEQNNLVKVFIEMPSHSVHAFTHKNAPDRFRPTIEVNTYLNIDEVKNVVTGKYPEYIFFKYKGEKYFNPDRCNKATAEKKLRDKGYVFDWLTLANRTGFDISKYERAETGKCYQLYVIYGKKSAKRVIFVDGKYYYLTSSKANPQPPYRSPEEKKLYGGLVNGFNDDTYHIAQQMKESGASPRAIWEKTMWYYSERDKKWKNEISDEEYRFKLSINQIYNHCIVKNKPIYLYDLISHKLLFDMIPDAKKIIVIFKEYKDDNNLGNYSYDSHKITLFINYKYYKKHGKEFLTPNDRLGKEEALIAEIQHYLQGRFRFAKDTGIKAANKRIVKRIKEERIRLEEALRNDDEYSAKLSEKIINKIERDFDGHVMFEYMCQLGEIESRDVIFRVDFEDYERKKEFPLSIALDELAIDDDEITTEFHDGGIANGKHIHKPEIIIHNNGDSSHDKDARKTILEYLDSLNISGTNVFTNSIYRLDQDKDKYDVVFYLNKKYKSTTSDYYRSVAIKYRKTIEEVYDDVLSSDSHSANFIRAWRDGNVTNYIAVSNFDVDLSKETKDSAISKLKSALLINDDTIEKLDNGGNIYSSSSRFKPYETIVFDPPITGVNGAKLISYTWAYEWTMLPNYEGELKSKRVSDWSQAESSADTGKNIVHQFTVTLPNGEAETVSSESVLVLLGYTDRASLKSFPSLVNSIKTLAKQKMQLAIMEAQEKEYLELKEEFDKSEKPEVKEVEDPISFVRERIKENQHTVYSMGDVWHRQDNPFDYDKKTYKKIGAPTKATIEQLTSDWVSSKIKERGGKRPQGLYDLKKRVNRQEKKVKELSQETSIETKQFADGGNINPDKQKEAEKYAKEFLESLSESDLKSIKDKFQSIISDVTIKEQDKLNTLTEQKTALENEITSLREKERELTYGEEKSAIFEQRQAINIQIGALSREIIFQQNVVKAVSSGGDLISFSDKKGVDYKGIPFFCDIKTDLISFDEETILIDPVPPYIPFINEGEFRGKGYVFDAIRISPDRYLIAVNGYDEVFNIGYRTREPQEHRHPTPSEQGYVIVTLDQLVLINDYYFIKAKAVEIKKANESNASTEKYYDSLSVERRLKFLNQEGYYRSLPSAVKKKVTQQEYEALSLEEKEKLYKPYKRTGVKRLTSKLEDRQMWVSFHEMYERFMNPLAVPINKDGTPIKEGQNRFGTFGSKETFAYWYDFRDMMKWKMKDIHVQREADSEMRKIALETSFGESNTNDVLKKEYGILVKRQNGTKILPNETEQIKDAWVKIENTFGSLSHIAIRDNLKISHTGIKFVFASKSAGVFIPTMKTIAVSNKFGDEQFENIMAHEVSHWIDFSVGALKGKRYATDDFESTAGEIASTFRRNMNAQTDSDYTNATKECFARAMEQYFAFENHGAEAELINSKNINAPIRTYHSEEDYVSKAKFEYKVKPLIIKFLSENESFFKYNVDFNK